LVKTVTDAPDDASEIADLSPATPLPITTKSVSRGIYRNLANYQHSRYLVAPEALVWPTLLSSINFLCRSLLTCDAAQE
jgi:hypothetical protein